MESKRCVQRSAVCSRCGRLKICRAVSFRKSGKAAEFERPCWACEDCRRAAPGSWRYSYVI